MTDAVGTVAVVEELTTPPCKSDIAYFSHGWGKSCRVSDYARIGIVLPRQKCYRCPGYSFSTRYARWCVGKDRCLSSRYIVCFPPLDQGGRMIVVSYQSDERGFVVWGRTRDERHFPKYTDSGCVFLR